MVGDHIILSMTGASGAGYGYYLLEALADGAGRTSLVINDNGLSILKEECGKTKDDLLALADEVIHDDRMDHELASGSNGFESMIICPCSTSTASKISSGIGDTLTTRIASVALKERRRLILAIRETPLSTPVLRSLYDLSSWGVTIMPISPSYYKGERSVDDLQVRFSGRVQDLLGMENQRTGRYVPKERR